MLDPATTPRFPNRETRYTSAYPPSPLEGAHGGVLRAALHELYAAYADAALSTDFDGCPHCFVPSDIAYLRATPLRDLSHGDICIVGGKLVTTLGSGADVSYFLPRLLEALAENALVDEDPLADRMLEIPAEHWTQRRLAAVRAVLRALLQDAYDRDDEDRAENVETLQAAVP